jgi:hypothetical protein
MARNSKHRQLPSKDQLRDPNFYQSQFYSNTVRKASEDIGKSIRLADSVISSPVDISYTLLVDANYEQAVQFLRASTNGGVSVRGRQPFRYDSSKGLILSEYANGLEGLAQVSIFSHPINFERNDIKEFGGGLYC